MRRSFQVIASTTDASEPTATVLWQVARIVQVYLLSEHFFSNGTIISNYSESCNFLVDSPFGTEVR